jgi:hypothetical protein
MQNKKIVYINQKNIPPVVVERIQELCPSYDHASLTKILNITSHQSFYSRLGKDTLPFKYNEQFFNARIPAVDSKIKDSFEYVTDQRCHELVKNYSDRPWLVQWSGGIDSTVIIASLLKNLSKQQLENIVVSCNHISVFENPKFYHNWIVPNFKIIDSTRLDNKYVNTHHIIDGNPADMLQGSGLGLYARNTGIDMSVDWKNNADQIIKFLSMQVSANAVKWMYSNIEENINSIDSDVLTIESTSDWFWWVNFNWKWPADRFHEMDWLHTNNLSPYFNSMINWFDSAEYQQWSINKGRYSLLEDNTDPGNYKLPSKKYIYQLDKNEHYLRFKTKLFSNSRVNTVSWLCVLDDLTTLSVEKDLDQILDLLPTHLNV